MSLKELEDFNWFPPLLRKYQMQCIGILVSKLELYRKIPEIIKADLMQKQLLQVVDLCSGSGYPSLYVHNKLDMPDVQSTLTDKFPLAMRAESNVYYDTEILDVLDFQPDKQKYFTMYNAFHHFEKEQQLAIVSKIIQTNSNLLIVEIVQPTFINFILVTLASIPGVMILTPFIKPFEWKRFLLTYVLPINIFTVLVDGYISILKSKSVNQYKKMFSTHFYNGSLIEVKQHFSFPAFITTIKISSYDAY